MKICKTVEFQELLQAKLSASELFAGMMTTKKGQWKPILFKKNDDTPKQVSQCCCCCYMNMNKDKNITKSTIPFHIVDFFLTIEILINYGILKALRFRRAKEASWLIELGY